MRPSVVVVCVVAIGACSSPKSSVPTPPSRSSSSSTAAPTTTTTAVADGRVPVYIKSIDVANRTMTYDQIQFLTGKAANDAFKRDHPDAGEDAPNDYYIVNVNPKLYTVPIAANATITVNVAGDGSSTDHPATLQQLRDDMHKDGADMLPFWVTISGGAIVKIEEQFVP